MTKKEKQDLLAEATASFEIEGITVTEQMLEDATKMLNGEISKDELIEIYIKEFNNIWMIHFL